VTRARKGSDPDIERFEKVNARLDEYEQVREEVLDLVPKPKRYKSARQRAGELLETLRGRWRTIKLTVIRPKNEIVLDLLHFSQDEIAEIIKQGRNTAKEELTCKCCSAGDDAESDDEEPAE
jgi:hypothetical protein